MLELQSVTKQFGKQAPCVNQVSMSLQRGVVGLIGHNGAGKTTLMNMIATLMRPTSGAILFQGTDIVQHPRHMQARLGYLPQEFSPPAALTARECLDYFAALKGVQDRAQVQRLLEMVNLHGSANAIASRFSGGMQRRLGIAQALLGSPEILIVDEPTAGLDPEERLRFRNLLAEIGHSKLVLLSTHIVSDVESIAGRLAIMKQGRLVADQTPYDIIRAAQGRVWRARVAHADYERLRAAVHILHAKQDSESMVLRIAHPTRPHDAAEPVAADLEEALMAQRYAEVAA